MSIATGIPPVGVTVTAAGYTGPGTYPITLASAGAGGSSAEVALNLHGIGAVFLPAVGQESQITIDSGGMSGSVDIHSNDGPSANYHEDVSGTFKCSALHAGAGGGSASPSPSPSPS